MSEIIIAEITPGLKINVIELREKIQKLIRTTYNDCECHSIRVWVEHRSDIK